MSVLSEYLAMRGIDPVEAMNLLQTEAPSGTVSDNAISAEDVSWAGKAIAWLENRFQTHRPLYSYSRANKTRQRCRSAQVRGIGTV